MSDSRATRPEPTAEADQGRIPFSRNTTSLQAAPAAYPYRYVAHMAIKPTPATIWKRPAYLPYVHAPLTDQAIRKAEKTLGCTLPTAFLDVLRVQNGGPIRFRIPESVGDMIAGIGPSFPSITIFDLKDCQEYVDFSLDGLVPFDGDGHWYYCLDFRHNDKNPGVSHIDVECNSEETVADSFSSFLSLMELDIKREMAIKNVANLDDARVRLEKLFGSPFEQKVDNLGVPYLKCQTGKQWDQCFWITGNKVAHGYSGNDPSNFQFEGEALLFPELSPDAVIFEAPDDYIDSYCAILRDGGFVIVDIESLGQAT